MWKSAEAFKRKKISLQAESDKKSKGVQSKTESAAQIAMRVKKELQGAYHLDEEAPS